MATTIQNSIELHDRRFIAAAMKAPMLEREYEQDLAKRWIEEGDRDALREIITSHVRLVVRIASRFRGYGLPQLDLIQEGNTGLLEAANRFDPGRNVRFSTYASWWILAAMQEYIVRNSAIVRIGTTPAQKSLFFSLRRLRAQRTDNTSLWMTDSERQSLAKDLGVPISAVERMEANLTRPDQSLNAPVGEDESEELLDFLADESATPDQLAEELIDGETRARWIEEAMQCLTPREREVIRRRFFTDQKTTLAEIGQSFGVTKERVRQIESKALSKLRTELQDRHGDNANP